MAWRSTKTRFTRCCAAWKAKACWSASGAKRTSANTRFYRLSSQGEATLGQLLEEWARINTSLERLQEA